MAKVQVRLKLKGINRLMRSRGVAGEVRRKAQEMATQAGDGFDVNLVPHKWTARAFVRAGTDEARARQARDKVLERVL